MYSIYKDGCSGNHGYNNAQNDRAHWEKPACKTLVSNMQWTTSITDDITQYESYDHTQHCKT